jgi:hypothetical protein
MLQTINHMVKRMYQDAHQDDRNAFHIGLLEGRLRELVYMLKEYEQHLNELESILKRND